MKPRKLIFLLFLPLLFLTACTQENVIQARAGEKDVAPVIEKFFPAGKS